MSIPFEDNTKKLEKLLLCSWSKTKGLAQIKEIYTVIYDANKKILDS